MHPHGQLRLITRGYAVVHFKDGLRLGASESSTWSFDIKRELEEPIATVTSEKLPAWLLAKEQQVPASLRPLFRDIRLGLDDPDMSEALESLAKFLLKSPN